MLYAANSHRKHYSGCCFLNSFLLQRVVRLFLSNLCFRNCLRQQQDGCKPMDCNHNRHRRSCHNRSHTCCYIPRENIRTNCNQMDHNPFHTFRPFHTYCPFPKESSPSWNPCHIPFPFLMPYTDECGRNRTGIQHSSCFLASMNQVRRSRKDC